LIAPAETRLTTPAEYAARYLPIQAVGLSRRQAIYIDRYRLGPPSQAQHQMWQQLGDHFGALQKFDRHYRLKLYVNQAPLLTTNREELRNPIADAFAGKGSPEDFQIVLQLAMLLGMAPAERLQPWTDEHLGLDCTGFVGNYLFHIVKGHDWRARPSASFGPFASIERLWRWAAGRDGQDALNDIKKIDPHRIHLIVKVDEDGRVMPGSIDQPGHIGLTEPGQMLAQPFVKRRALAGAAADDEVVVAVEDEALLGKPAFRTVEASGPPRQRGMGLGLNWTVFTRRFERRALDRRTEVWFERRRDRYRAPQLVKIAPLPDLPDMVRFFMGR
jgi:hypothetical protein